MSSVGADLKILMEGVMKKFFTTFLLFSFVCVYGWAQNVPFVNLANLDGTKKPIEGLMGGYVPHKYFAKNLLKSGSFDLNYHAQFSLDLNEFKGDNAYLHIENSDGAPIVVSFILPWGKWYNFIVKMNDSKAKDVEINYGIDKLFDAISKKFLESGAPDEIVQGCSLVLTSGSKFKASLSVNGRTKKVKVQQPLVMARKEKTFKQSKVSNDTDWCATITNHPELDTDGDGYAEIKVTNDVNGVSNYAWFKITGEVYPIIGCEGLPPHKTYVLSFRVDYPNKGDEWHVQDDEKQSWSVYYCDEGLCYCFAGRYTGVENYNFYTCCNMEKPYETKHEWQNMRNLYWYWEKGKVIRYYPASDYLTWTVELIHR